MIPFLIKGAIDDASRVGSTGRTVHDSNFVKSSSTGECHMKNDVATLELFFFSS